MVKFNMKIRLADSTILKDSIVDGEGLRAVIWTQGCSHNCRGCHNPETHDFNGGVLVDTNLIKNQLDELLIQDGITFSGGDPFFQVEACLDIAKYAKSKNLNIWCYTGFMFEDLIKNNHNIEFLNYVDVLVDGKFELENKSYDCQFRGSTNQRIINVSKSLKEGRTCLIKKYNIKPKVLQKCLFI